MVDVLFLLCGALCVVATVYKYRDLRRGSKNRPLGALTLGLCFLGAAFISAAPVVYTFLNALLGVPNVMRLVAHVFIVAFACSIAQMLLHWAYPPELAVPRGRRRLIGYGAVLVLLVILFVAAPVDEEAVDWTVRYGHSPLVASYLIVYVLALGVATLEIARLSHRYAGFLPAGAMRAGLRFNTVGASFGLAYCLYKAAYLLGRQAGPHLPDGWAWLSRDEIITPLLAFPGAVLVVIGLTLPSWGPAVSRAWKRFGQYRAYRDLYPLWLDLYQAEPGILFGNAVPPTRPWRSVGPLLERLAIEIPDGVLRLTPYFHPIVQENAEVAAVKAGITGDKKAAAVQAACIAGALAARARDHRAAEPAAPRFGDARTMREQIAWLRPVGRAYRRSPVVRATLSHAGSVASAVTS